MKPKLLTQLFLYSVGLVAVLGILPSSYSQILYATNINSGNIRISTDGGLNWTNWITGGSQFSGITIDNPNSATHRVIVLDRGAGSANNRPVYAIPSATANGTAISSVSGLVTTSMNPDGASNARPLYYYNGYVYYSGSGTGSELQYASWDGSTFGTFAATGSLTWSGNDMAAASSGGNHYLWLNGTSGTNLRRLTLAGDGTASSPTSITSSFTSGSPTIIRDLLFTPSGRMLALTDVGIYATATDAAGSNSPINFSTLLFTFSGTSFDSSTGNVGNLGREMVLWDDKLFVFANDGGTGKMVRFTYNDSTATLTYDNIFNANIGISGDNLHVVVAIPEPSALILGMIGLAGVALLRRRKSLTPSSLGR